MFKLENFKVFKTFLINKFYKRKKIRKKISNKKIKNFENKFTKIQNLETLRWRIQFVLLFPNWSQDRFDLNTGNVDCELKPSVLKKQEELQNIQIVKNKKI